MKAAFCAVSIIAFLAAGASTVRSQTSADSLKTPQILGISASVRSASLAFTGVADPSDPGNVFHNPTAVLGAQHLSVMADYLAPSDSVELSGFSVASRIPMPKFLDNWLYLGAGLGYTQLTRSRLPVDEIPGENNRTGEDSYLTGTLAAGIRLWVLELGAGVNSKRVSSDFAGDEDRYYSTDVGAMARLRFGKKEGPAVIPTLGVTIPHLSINSDKTAKFEKVRFGGSVRIISSHSQPFFESFQSYVPTFSLLIAADVVEAEESEEVRQIGLASEASVVGFFHLRGGYRENREGLEYKSVGFGVGPKVDQWIARLDIVWTDVEGTRGWGFGANGGFNF